MFKNKLIFLFLFDNILHLYIYLIKLFSIMIVYSNTYVINNYFHAAIFRPSYILLIIGRYIILKI